MNLYYAVTNYHLLCCILHAIKYHSKERNVLYLSCWHPDHEFLIKQLKKTNIFSRVELFQEVSFPSGNKKISNKQLEIDIKKIIDGIPKKFIEDVKRSDEINIAGDHYCASVYLEQKKIMYNYLEEACGVLSDEERLMKIIKNIDYSRYQIMKKLKLPGNHSFIKIRYGDLNNQLEGYHNDKDFHFSVPETLKLLSKAQIYEIVKVFSEEEFTIPKNSTLLLTFHYVNMNLLNLGEQRYLYSMLLDYFFKGENLIIKQHPSDVQPNYREWFPKAIILPRKMPSELLPFLSENKFSRALTSYSTSIFAMKSYCNDVISFGMYIERNFKMIHKYYFLFQLLKEYFNKDKTYQIFGIGLYESIVKNIFYQYDINQLEINFLNNISDILEKDTNKIIIVDDYILDDSVLKIMVPNNVVFYLNEEKSIPFLMKYSSNELENIISILLKKQVIDNSGYVYDALIDENIFYYCCNHEFIDIFSNLNMEKVLENCNMKINIEQNSAREILILQEKIRLLYKEKENLEINSMKEQVYLENFIEKERNHFKIETEELKLQLEQKNLKNNELTEEIRKYRKLYDEIVNSSSWKITGVYRKIGGIIKKIVRS